MGVFWIRVSECCVWVFSHVSFTQPLLSFKRPPRQKQVIRKPHLCRAGVSHSHLQSGPISPEGEVETPTGFPHSSVAGRSRARGNLYTYNLEMMTCCGVTQHIQTLIHLQCVTSQVSAYTLARNLQGFGNILPAVDTSLVNFNYCLIFWRL